MHPIILSFGPITIYSFGVLLALGFILAIFVIWRHSRHYFEDEEIFDGIVMVTILGILGARAFYIIFHFADFGFQILRFFHFFLYPGFSFWGGVIGGLVGGIFYTWRKKLNFWRIADFGVLGFSFGQIFGQIGYFLNGGEVGKETTLPWGLAIPGFLEKRHPVAAYEAILALLIFFFLLKIKKLRGKEGMVFLLYLIGWGAISFFSEFLKVERGYFLNLTVNQISSLIFLGVAGILLYRRQRSLRQDLRQILSLAKLFKRRRNGNS